MNEVLIGSVDPYSGLGFGRYNVDTIWTDTLSKAIGNAIEPFIQAPSPKTHILGTPRHGAKLQDSAAFSSLAKSFLGIYSVWDEAHADVQNIKNTYDIAAIFDSHAQGRYINELDGFAFPEKVAECFSNSTAQRLSTLRSHYDEGNLFHGFPGK